MHAKIFSSLYISLNFLAHTTFQTLKKIYLHYLIKIFKQVVNNVLQYIEVTRDQPMSIFIVHNLVESTFVWS